MDNSLYLTRARYILTDVLLTPAQSPCLDETPTSSVPGLGHLPSGLQALPMYTCNPNQTCMHVDHVRCWSRPHRWCPSVAACAGLRWTAWVFTDVNTRRRLPAPSWDVESRSRPDRCGESTYCCLCRFSSTTPLLSTIAFAFSFFLFLFYSIVSSTFVAAGLSNTCSMSSADKAPLAVSHHPSPPCELLDVGFHVQRKQIHHSRRIPIWPHRWFLDRPSKRIRHTQVEMVIELG